MNPVTILQLFYLLSAILFVLGLKRLGSPATARQGNALAALAMLIAIVATLVEQQILSWQTIGLGLVLGSVIGAFAARTIKMTDMPQLVGIFNGLGGGASGVVAAAEFFGLEGSALGVEAGVTILLATLIGAVTFSGSFIAFGKLQGFISVAPLTFPFSKTVNALLFLTVIVIGVTQVAGVPTATMFLVLTGVALLLGILLVTPIGGADMPVVISLLNSYSGLAASAAGFVLGNMILIISGALVGAAGLILTSLMCKAMNRSLANVAFGAFGGGDSKGRITTGEGQSVRGRGCRAGSDGAGLCPVGHRRARLRAGSRSGSTRHPQAFGPAPGAGRHREVRDPSSRRPHAGAHERAAGRSRRSVYPAVRPGRDQLRIRQYRCSVDRRRKRRREPGCTRAGLGDHGMPILDVDRSANVIVMKRSLSPGFAGIDNPLFYMDRTMMFFGDARPRWWTSCAR